MTNIAKREPKNKKTAAKKEAPKKETAKKVAPSKKSHEVMWLTFNSDNQVTGAFESRQHARNAQLGTVRKYVVA